MKEKEEILVAQCVGHTQPELLTAFCRMCGLGQYSHHGFVEWLQENEPQLFERAERETS